MSLERGRAERQSAVEKAKRELMALEGQRREVAARAPDAARHTLA